MQNGLNEIEGCFINFSVLEIQYWKSCKFVRMNRGKTLSSVQNQLDFTCAANSIVNPINTSYKRKKSNDSS